MDQGLFLRNEVRQGTMETAQFGSHFLTYFRCHDDDRVISLARYENENTAREGHQKWITKDWKHKSIRDILKEDD